MIMIYYDSPEIIALRKLITSKKKYLATIKVEFAYQQLQKEIMLLEKDILPIVLNNSSVNHSEFARYALTCFDLALTHRCNGLLIYQPIELQYAEQPKIGICNSMANSPYRTPGAVEVFVVNMDGYGVEPMPLNLNAFMP